MVCLVTGATGLVGNNLVRQLLDQGRRVRVLVRDVNGSRPLQSLAVETVAGDIRDRESVDRATQGVGVVFHAAANLHIGRTNFASIRRINVEGTRNVAQAARRADAKLVYVSTVDALAPGRRDQPADEQTPDRCKADCTYVVTKREAERVVFQEVESGLRAVVVNPSFMLGPWDWKPSSGRMLLTVAKSRPPLAPSGGFSICDVRDAAAAMIRAADVARPGERYILAGHNLTYLEVWRRFAQLTGGRPPFATIGPVVRCVVGWMGDTWSKLTGKEGDVNSAMLELSTQFHYYSSQRALMELDYRIRPLDECISAAWNWFREYGYA
jgi:dihydroflavonol-4-reductase